MSEPVAVTGAGVATPAGLTVKDLWAAIVAGRGAARSIDRFDASHHRVRIGCQVPELPVPLGVDPKMFRRSDLFTRYGLTASAQAINAASFGDVEQGRVAVVVGNAVGGRHTSDNESLSYARRGPGAVTPLMPSMTMGNAAAASIAMVYGLTGPAHTIATTCASGLDAIGYARTLLLTDQADVVVVGGCEATLTPVTMAAFAAMGALSGRNDDPAAASRPFDASRDGFVMGEGAAFLVLEREVDAAARKADTLGRVLGYAATSDAHHLSAPHPDGLGAKQAMSKALEDAGLTPEDIVHVNAHGTSTRLNDATEAVVISEVFGEFEVPVTAPKGVTGHMLGASGVAEALISLISMQRQVVPPVAGLEMLDPALPIDAVGTARPVRHGPAITNSFGFGGHNATVVLDAPPTGRKAELG